jgi:phosphatidate cytidylyltransferase
MASVFGATVCSGHRVVAVSVIAAVVEIFRELVAVGMRNANDERQLPLYRTLQWLWFAVAMLVAYSADVLEAPMSMFDSASKSHAWIAVGAAQASPYRLYCLVLLYSGTFMLTVLSLRKEHLNEQIRILSFTFFALSLFMFQLKVMIYNLFTGLFWFILPLLLVAVNDTMAYFFGRSFGRRFFKHGLTELSTSKTWEGFLGGGCATVLMGWLTPSLLAQVLSGSQWAYLTCSFIEYDKLQESCTPPEHFTLVGSSLPALRMHCAILALFASVVAPFGGFMASAVKRAYGLKDFDTFIPGHGGLMDRIDCQFLMSLFTWAHVSTFLENVPMNACTVGGSSMS